MIGVNVKLDIERARRSIVLAQRDITQAAARAINKAANGVATVGGREISARTKIPVREVRQRMKVMGANGQRLYATVTAYPYSPNLSKFKATQQKAGVAATAWEGRKTYRGSFMMPSGRVVTRTGPGRFPLKGLRGPSVPRTFEREPVASVLVAEAEKRFAAEFERQLRLKGASEAS